MDTDITPDNDGDFTEEAPPPEPPPLVRPRQGRVVAGVAAALGHRFNLSPLLVRVLFVLATFAAGAGVVAYAAGWLLIRDENEAEAPAERFLGGLSGSGAWVGVALIALAAIIVLERVTFVSGALVWAAVLAVVGVLLYRGDLSRPRRAKPSASAPPRAFSEPTDPPGPLPPPPAPPRPPSRLGRLTISLALLGLGGLALADNLSPLVNANPRHYLAVAVLALGVGLLVGSVWGRARWLILVGALLVPPLLVSPVAELPLAGGSYDQPADFDEVGVYRQGFGGIHLDLTRLPWDGETLPVQIDLGAGEIRVELPPDVGVEGDAEIGVGALTVMGRQSGGPDLDRSFSVPGQAGTVELEVRVGAGQVTVTRSGEDLVWSRGSLEVVPEDLGDLRSGYRVRNGDLTIDLTGLPRRQLDGPNVTGVVGRGDLTVVLPSGMAAEVNARANNGTVEILGADRGSGAVSDSVNPASVDEGGPIVYLDLVVGNGDIFITEGEES